MKIYKSIITAVAYIEQFNTLGYVSPFFVRNDAISAYRYQLKNRADKYIEYIKLADSGIKYCEDVLQNWVRLKLVVKIMIVEETNLKASIV